MARRPDMTQEPNGGTTPASPGQYYSIVLEKIGVPLAASYVNFDRSKVAVTALGASSRSRVTLYLRFFRDELSLFSLVILMVSLRCEIN